VARRSLDVVASAAGLALLSPVLALIAAAVKLDSPGPVFFRQERVGRAFRPFRILKFRTMSHAQPAGGPLITAGGDARITRVGRLLRGTKLDELPQLLNVLAGEMSLVGPRPEVARYVDLFRDEYRRLLTVPPGMTDPASLRFVDEERLLASATDRERCYVETILPEKIRLSQEYLDRRTLAGDLALIAGTIFGRRG
jgi:lipopolysaccharide/colanic/teichoic acid biosynthesis glycosyltransferase